MDVVPRLGDALEVLAHPLHDTLETIAYNFSIERMISNLISGSAITRYPLSERALHIDLACPAIHPVLGR